MFPRSVLSMFLVALVSLSGASVNGRTWSDNTGKFSVEAEFVKLGGGKVTLRREDGEEIQVPLDRLSETDQQYIESLRSQRSRSKPKPAVPGEESQPTEQPNTAATNPADASDVKVGQVAIEKALLSPAQCSFNETPLGEVPQAITEEHGIGCFLDLRSLNDVGLGAAAPVSFEDDGQTLEEMLDTILEPMSLTWTIHHEVLMITTKEETVRQLSTRVYMAPGAAGNPRALIEQITQSIAPNTWSDVGGSGNAEACTANTIVIMQTYAIHREIQREAARMLQPVRRNNAVRPRRGGAASAVTAALSQPTTCEFIETSLYEVFQSLAERHDIKITLDESALAEVGMATDMPITFRLHGAKLESALSLLLEQLDLTWIADDSGVTVTTPESAAANIVDVSYDIRDLLQATPGGVDTIINTIQSTVTPWAWSDFGGPGSIQPAPPSALRIRQTFHAHRSVERLLSDLRQTFR